MTAVGDARKRRTEAHQIHPDPAVCVIVAREVAAAVRAVEAERLAGMERARSIDPKISNAHFPQDGACPASGVPVESCDTCNVLTAYAEREQRWYWNLIREQNANARAEAAEKREADLRAAVEALADTKPGATGRALRALLQPEPEPKP